MTDLFIYLLAVFGVSWTLSSEEGPGGSLDRMRSWVRPVLGQGVDCPICVSFWVSIAMYLVWLTPQSLIMIPFAGHGLVILLILIISRLGTR